VSPDLLGLLAEAMRETLTMVALSAIIGTMLGLPLGVFLATSRRGELLAAAALNAVLGLLVNATRSTPSSSWSSRSSRSPASLPGLPSGLPPPPYR
jgi:D-methionine transport system permease protein